MGKTAVRKENVNEMGTEGYKVGKGHPPKEHQFKPGYDPRRTGNGRPKSFDHFREFIKELGAEEISLKDIKGKIRNYPLFEAMLRNMFASKNPADRKLLIEYAFGRVPYDLKIEATDAEHDFTEDEIGRLAAEIVRRNAAKKKPKQAEKGAKAEPTPKKPTPKKKPARPKK